MVRLTVGPLGQTIVIVTELSLQPGRMELSSFGFSLSDKDGHQANAGGGNPFCPQLVQSRGPPHVGV